jgi:dipeptidyl aminopeptidase/acylaminoacyl peptidase
MNPDTGKKRRIETEFYGRTSNVTWMPDGKSVLYNESRKTNQNLFRMEIGTGKVTPVTNITGSLITYAFSKDRKKMVYTFSDFDTPKDIYSSSVKEFKPLRLTDANPWVKEEILLGKAEVISWKSKGGMEIEGLFYLPGDYKKGTKLPLIVYIHGGPQGVFSNLLDVYYSATTMDLHLYTGLGYAVLAPNVRGSSGYGDELLRGLIGEVGDGEYIDQMTGVDKLIEEGYVDPDQMGIRGSSWGGVSTSYTITQTQRFKAATIESGVTNWAAEVGPGFSFDLGLWYIGGKPWDNPEEWRDHSSITHVKNITTPTLIVHGGEDQTSSVGQSLMLFTAIRDIGKAPVRYIKLPRQGHDFLEPRLSRIMTIEEVKWMQKYIRDIDWKPWERDSGL